jgi:hypothetical protein
MEIMISAWREKAPAKIALIDERRLMVKSIQELYHPYVVSLLG